MCRFQLSEVEIESSRWPEIRFKPAGDRAEEFFMNLIGVPISANLISKPLKQQSSISHRNKDSADNSD